MLKKPKSKLKKSGVLSFCLIILAAMTAHVDGEPRGTRSSSSKGKSSSSMMSMKTMMSMLTGVLSYVILKLVGVDFAAVWALLIFLLNACSAGFTPTFQATIPDVLPDEARYTRALSLSRLAYDLENLLSPTLAAAALVLMSYHALFAANAVAFLVSAVLVYSVRLPTARAQERERGVWQNVSFGIRSYLKTPRLRGLLALSMAVASGGDYVLTWSRKAMQTSRERSDP